MPKKPHNDEVPEVPKLYAESWNENQHKEEVQQDDAPGVVPTKEEIESLITELGNDIQILQELAIQDSNSLLASRLTSFKSEVDKLAERYRTSISPKL